MLPFPPPLATSLRVEYGDLQCTLEVVDDVKDAVEHINKFSSNHTDSIITENRKTKFSFSVLIKNKKKFSVSRNYSKEFSPKC